MESKSKIPVKKMTIWAKLFIGIIVIMVLTAFIAIQGINSINKLRNLSSVMLNESIANNTVQNLKSNLEKLIMPPNDYLIHGNRIEFKNFGKSLTDVKAQLNEYSVTTHHYIEKLPPNELVFYLGEVEALALEIFKLEEPIGNKHGADLMEKMDSIINMVTIQIDYMIIAEEEDIGKNILKIHTTNVKYTRIIILVGLAIVFSLLFGGFFYVKEITKPIHHLAQTAQKVSSGNLSTKAEVNTHDEIEDLANSFNTMIGVLEKTTVSREYFNNILNRMEDSLIISDASDNIKIVNQATLDLLGYNEDEIVGKPIGMVASEKGSKEICVKSDAIKKFIKKEHVDNVYNTYYSKDGNPIPVLFSRSLMYDKDKLISGMIFIGHNITENNGEIKAMQENGENNYRNIKTLGEIPLTKRELEIIKLIAEEFSNLEIAEKLFISVRTVETHRRNIMQKLHINSVISLVHYAIQNSII